MSLIFLLGVGSVHAGITITGADGITATGADGITITGADGIPRRADSVLITNPTGITATGADGITATGADGITETGTAGITATGADGITITGADGITATGADGITATGADGQIFSISPSGITITGADGITATGADGITITGADEIRRFSGDGITATGADSQPGLRSVDPELALLLNRITDDSNVNAVVVYHRLPTDADIAELQRIGVTGGTRYRALPMIVLTATRGQIISISRLQTVRSIYGNRTLQATLELTTRAATGADRVPRDAELTSRVGGSPVSGRGVTVAVLDTGLDGTHNDFASRVAHNIKLLDPQSASVGFGYPAVIENLPNTDQVYGHGTFVAGVIAGNGARSGGRYTGVAPEARLVGLSAGDLTLAFVLSGFDYLLANESRLSARASIAVSPPIRSSTRTIRSMSPPRCSSAVASTSSFPPATRATGCTR